MAERTPAEVAAIVRALVTELRAATVLMRTKANLLSIAQDEFNLAQADVRRVKNLLTQEFDSIGKD